MPNSNLVSRIWQAEDLEEVAGTRFFPASRGGETQSASQEFSHFRMINADFPCSFPCCRVSPLERCARLKEFQCGFFIFFFNCELETEICDGLLYSGPK